MSWPRSRLRLPLRVRDGKTEIGRDGPERRDDVRDVLVELEAEKLCTRVDLVPVHTGCERRLFQLFPHRLRLQALEPGRPHEPARMHEPGELVARKQCPH